MTILKYPVSAPVEAYVVSLGQKEYHSSSMDITSTGYRYFSPNHSVYHKEEGWDVVYWEILVHHKYWEVNESGEIHSESEYDKTYVVSESDFESRIDSSSQTYDMYADCHRIVHRTGFDIHSTDEVKQVRVLFKHSYFGTMRIITRPEDGKIWSINGYLNPDYYTPVQDYWRIDKYNLPD